MNGVIYARFSSDHQREESIEGQIRICKEYAKKKGITIINEYVDRAISGKTDKRPSFQKMIADSDTKLFQVVIVYALDRFARNSKQSAIYENMLNLNGVQLHSATENISGAPSSIILKAVLQGVAEYYSAELATKITRGMTENALKGKWTSGTTPFGYVRDKEKHLQPNPVTASYVHDIFAMFVDGQRFVDIADYLNTRGIKTAVGGKFNKGSFHRLLTNRIYIGEYAWKDVKLEDAVPPLISQDLFNKAQKLLEVRKTTMNSTCHYTDNYLLSARIFCAHCGGPLNGMCGTSKTRAKHRYYVCSNRKRKKADCDFPNIPCDKVDNTIRAYLKMVLSDEKSIREIARKAIEAQDTAAENAELVRLQNQQKDLQKKIDNCVKAVENGLVSDAIITRLKESEAALATVKKEIAEQNIMLQASMLSEAQVVFFLTKMINEIDKNDDAIKALVHAVFVEYKKDSDEYIITAQFNYSKSDSLNRLQDFRVRTSSPLVGNERVFSNFVLCCLPRFFQITYSINRKTQRPAI